VGKALSHSRAERGFYLLTQMQGGGSRGVSFGLYARSQPHYLTGGRLTRKQRREAPSHGARHADPPYVPMVRRPGDKGSAFRDAPLAEPKAQQQLLEWLGTNATVVMWCVAGAVVVTVLVLLVTGA
jgi:hypothetical protein